MKDLSLRALSTLIVCLFAIFLSITHHSRLPYFDVFDEGPHFDYVVNLQQRQVPVWGQKLDQQTLRVSECLGYAWTEPGDCSNKVRNPEIFGALGYSYEVQQPPLAYLPYAAAPIDDLKPLDQLNRMRNIGGTVWILLTGLAAFALSHLRRLGFWSTTLLSGLVLLNPAQIHAFSTVNNDAAVAFGTLVFLTALTRDRAISLKVGLVIGVLLGLIKGLLIVVPVSAAAVIWFNNRNRKDPFEKWRLNLAISASISAFVTFVSYTLIQKAFSLIDSSVVLEALLGFSKTNIPHPNMFLTSLKNQLSPFEGQILSLGIGENAWFTILNFSALIFVGFILAGRNVDQLKHQDKNYFLEASLVKTWLVVALSISIAWPLFLFTQGGYYFDAPQRYTLMAIPFVALAIVQGLNTIRQSKTT